MSDDEKAEGNVSDWLNPESLEQLAKDDLEQQRINKLPTSKVAAIQIVATGPLEAYVKNLTQAEQIQWAINILQVEVNKMKARLGSV